MRRWLSIARATALEILSEPLSLLLLLAALALATLAPAFHYHQFGEVTRMARDSGLSALFVGGVLVAVFGTIRTFRREIETGTAQMALVHPVSRSGFFLAKTFGAGGALLFFLSVVAAVALCIVRGAEIGGRHSDCCGDIARIWGPSLAIGVSTLVLPLAAAAALNRFARWRFVPTAFAFAFILALAGTCYHPNGVLAARLLPVAVLVAVPSLVLLAAAAAFAVRFKANVAAAATGVAFAALVPFIGNYYLSDALAKGGVLPWGYVALALAAALPAGAAFLLLGLHFINGRDLA